MLSDRANSHTNPQLSNLPGGTALPHWDDLLASTATNELLESPLDDAVWDLPELSDPAGEDDIIAPSAAEIDSLLSRLGGVSTEPPQPRTGVLATPPPDLDSAARSIQSLDPELREAFLDDASSCVASMERALLRLESDPQHADSLSQICRELHTLKGASASVGFLDLADQLHQIEESLSQDLAASRTAPINSLLNSVDQIRLQIVSLNPACDGSASAAANGAAGSSDLEAALTPDSQAAPFADVAEDDESVRVKSSQLNRLMDMLAELVMLRNRRATELTELQEIYHGLIQSVSKMRMLSIDGDSQEITSGSLQVTEVANDVLEAAQRLRHCARPVADGNTAVSQFIRQFRQELVELRRTPIAGLFRRLQRVVRDASQTEGKDVRLQLHGEDAGIERALQQRLYEPLLHIVRNSVCHGIEMPQERLKRGKPAVGTITLQAKSGPDLFVIEIRDDGRGLDYDAIRRRGIESGLLAADQDASREELAQLIFHSGFSTRRTANQVAGRGVGMDVVASTLQRMRGWLQVDSQPYLGTQIRLSFPLPSVIQHTMVFRCGGQLFALPMQSVQSAGGVDSTAIELDFSAILGCQQPVTVQPRQPIVLACQSPAPAASGQAAQRVTLLVDEIIGPEEVVVRPLPGLLRHHPFCSGATLSGMGETVLVLDARRLVESQTTQLISRPASNIQDCRPLATSAEQPAQSARLRALVVDDSVTARKSTIRCLSRYPIDIVEATDGQHALEILASESFAIVLSDIEMPRINGMDLLAELRASEREHRPPVVIISSRSEIEFSEQAKQRGAAGYLIKPLTNDALDQMIASIPSLAALLFRPPSPPACLGERGGG